MTKVFRAPVGVALALCLIAASAYGQTLLSVGANPTRIRGEGITETTGLMTLTNGTNAAQVIPGGTTITITYDGLITNNPAIATTAVGPRQTEMSIPPETPSGKFPRDSPALA